MSIEGEAAPRLAQLRRQSGKRSMPVPGDVAIVRILEDDKTVIETLEPRAFCLERRTTDGRSKTMAANVGTLVTVSALANPEPRLITLDQLLAFAELESIEALVIFTKPDLAERAVADALGALYQRLGYSTLVLNPKSGDIAPLREALVQRHSLLCGISGVGKSSIFRALGGEASVGSVSRHGLGRQTTTTARLFRLGEGFLIDSPGVNEFGLGDIQAPELAWAFREMRNASEACRFTDCTHLREPGCGVRAAVDEGRIAASRYASYTHILLEGT